MCHADTDGIDTLNTNKSLGNAPQFCIKPLTVLVTFL